MKIFLRGDSYFARIQTAPGVVEEIDLGISSRADTRSSLFKKYMKKIESALLKLESAGRNEGSVNLYQGTFAESVLRKASSMPVKTAVQKWMTFREEVGQGEPSTLYSLKIHLIRWMNSTKCADKSISEITAKDIHNYINDPSTSWKHGTRKVLLSTFKNFFKFLVDEGHTFRNPAGNIKVSMRNLSHSQIEPKHIKIFSDEDYAKLMAVCPPVWKLLIALSYHTGLRLGDAASLEWDSLNEDFSCVVVWTDKRDKRVEVPLPQELQTAFETLKLSKKDYWPVKYCFPQQRVLAQNPKKRAGLSVKFSRLCKKAGLSGYSFHCLRHTFITKLAQSGKTLEDIGKLVGHSNTKTTEVYVHDE